MNESIDEETLDMVVLEGSDGCSDDSLRLLHTVDWQRRLLTVKRLCRDDQMVGCSCDLGVNECLSRCGEAKIGHVKLPTYS